MYPERLFGLGFPAAFLMTFHFPRLRAFPTLAALASFAGFCLSVLPILDRVNCPGG